MSKLLRLVALIGFAALSAASCDEGSIDNLQKQIDQLKTGEIASVTKQVEAINTSINDLKAVDNGLKDYIAALQKDGETYKAQIAELTAMDKTLEGQIADLQAYADSGIKDCRDWASATFATIEKYDGLCDVVAGISSRIDEISEDIDKAKAELTEAYRKAIGDAVASLEASMKAWVSDKLTGYYTIAQLDAKLDSLAKAHDKAAADLKDLLDGQQEALDSLAKAHEEADALLIKQIGEQKVAIVVAKKELTAAYEAAIKAAIEEYDGKIAGKVADAVNVAAQALKTQVDAITGAITDIKDRLDILEANIEKLISRIQSIAVVSDYFDGSVLVRDGSTTIRFDVRPVTRAKALVELYKSDKSAVTFSFKIVKTLTKGEAAPELKVLGVGFNDSTRQLEVTADGSGLGTEFFKGAVSYSASFNIATKDGIINFSSGYFALYAPTEQ